MTTQLGCVPAAEHTQVGHPENAGRISAIMDLLERSGMLHDLEAIESVAATNEQLENIHTSRMINRVKLASSVGGGRLDVDTYATAFSYEQARLAAGTVCALVDDIMSGMARNGIALVRPPGHHAEVDRVGGFCLFNNVAVAARHAQARFGADRILIIDYDVHHGNGTQDIFYNDPSILYVSLHLYSPFFYPGTGSIDEIGSGIGKGANLNVPFAPGAGDLSYETIFREVIQPRVARFSPDLILVSAGFDAHWADPLAAAGLSLTGYSKISRMILDMASDFCRGKILFVLEGGYHLEALSYGVLNAIYALLEKDEMADPLGNWSHQEPDISLLVAELQHLHLPS